MTVYRSTVAGVAAPATGTPSPGAFALLPSRGQEVVVPDDLHVVGLSFGHADDAAAELWLASLPVPPVLACTHLVRVPYPHVAVSLALPPGAPAPAPGEDVLGPAAELAADAHRARRSGRAVRYPGVEHLIGELTVADLLTVSAIERVHVLGGGPADLQTLIDTRDHVRPQWMDGALTLITTPAAGGRLVPFEQPNPTPCCADHA